MGWRGSDVTTEIKSNANTKLHYPSRTLADPSSLPSCSHTLPWHTPPRPFLPAFFRRVASLRFSHPLAPTRPRSPSKPPCPPRDPCRRPMSLVRLFSRLRESPHRSHPPPGNNSPLLPPLASAARLSQCVLHAAGGPR